MSGNLFISELYIQEPFIVPAPQMVLSNRVRTTGVDFVILLNVADYLSVKRNVNSIVPFCYI